MWYSAKILLICDVEGSNNPSLSEESIRLFSAENEEEVRKRIEKELPLEENSYFNSDNEKVTWRYVKIIDIQDLCEEKIEDGMEVYSYLFEQ